MFVFVGGQINRGNECHILIEVMVAEITISFL